MNVRACLLLLCAGSLCAPRVESKRIELLAGGLDDAVDVAAVRARLHEPFGVGFNLEGEMYVIEMAKGNRLLKVDTTGLLTHVAGRQTPGDGGDGGPALEAQFNGPHNIAVLPGGDVLIGDTWNGRVRRFEAARGVVSAFPGFTVPADKARTNGPYCVTLSFDGATLYVADLRRIHAVDVKTGTVRVVAGNGEKGVPQDGAVAIEAPLFDPRAAAPDRKGNLYILERGGHALRVVRPDGTIRTVVNASGVKGGSGDGGDALAATMNGPKHLCVDPEDNVIIADAENHLIRKYVPATGKILRVAGTGQRGAAGIGGAPEQCELNRPHGVTMHHDGSLVIADSDNDRILRIVP